MTTRLVMLERRKKALKMKLEGSTHLQIGYALGVSPETVSHLLSPTARRRAELLEAASNRCDECGIQSKKLMAHHDDYSKEPSKILCQSCHAKLHAKLAIPRNFIHGPTKQEKRIKHQDAKLVYRTFRFPVWMLRSLRGYAESSGIPMTRVVEQVIDDFLSQNEALRRLSEPATG